MNCYDDGLERFENWRNINELAPSIEMTGEAGDFVLMHHMMSHGASRNKQATPRVAQVALTELGRKLFRLDPWVA